MIDRSMADFDVVIVGSGPAGVSAAFPLIEAGLRVLMVDAGRTVRSALPSGHFLDLRRYDENQWEWMVGHDYRALQNPDAASPKLRVPTHAAVFEGFHEANRVRTDGFAAFGSLAPGGLSGAWGGGVACLTDEELSPFPVSPEEMRRSYGAVALRIGISGSNDDDLSEFFGLDQWSQPPVPIDVLQGDLLARYCGQRRSLIRKGFRLGRSRVAVLAEPLSGRAACDRSGGCLWGCQRRALYSATDDLRTLCGHPGFHYYKGFVATRIVSAGGYVSMDGRDERGAARVRARKILLAAGTLATTRLALQAIGHRAPVTMHSCPTAAFLLWLPRHLGRAHDAAFGLGQLSFTLALDDGTRGFGSLFSTTGIPVAEFARHIPLRKRYAIDFLRSLLTSCVVGNFFLPGAMTHAILRLETDDSLVVSGNYGNAVPHMMDEVKRRLRTAFFGLGAILLPASFRIGRPGSDIHYAASLPMRANPVPGQTDRYGELTGAPGLHIIDGASLSSLPAKSHTLTIMANADRIARHICSEVQRDV